MTEIPVRERLARALKADIASQWDAKPAPGSDPRDDWTAEGGTLDLTQCVDAILAELDRILPETVATAISDIHDETPWMQYRAVNQHIREGGR